LAISNKNFSIKLLEKLSDGNLYRKEIVNNINCPYDILKFFYKKDKYLQSYIIKHPNWKLNGFI